MTCLIWSEYFETRLTKKEFNNECVIELVVVNCFRIVSNKSVTKKM